MIAQRWAAGTREHVVEHGGETASETVVFFDFAASGVWPEQGPELLHLPTAAAPSESAGTLRSQRGFESPTSHVSRATRPAGGDKFASPRNEPHNDRPATAADETAHGADVRHRQLPR